MSREQIESIPEFKILIDALRAHKLDNVVWDVIGGSPIDYSSLMEALNTNTSLFQLPSVAVSKDVVDEVKGYLQSKLSEALHKIVLKSSANTETIINVFREKKISKLTSGEFKALGLSLEYPNKVFREVLISGRCYYVPATPAVSLIVTKNIRNDDDLFQLMEDLFQDFKKN
jgi:hypothetical protein